MISAAILSIIGGLASGLVGGGGGAIVGGGVLGLIGAVLAGVAGLLWPMILGGFAIPWAAGGGIIGVITGALGGGLLGALLLGIVNLVGIPAGLSQLHILSFFHQGFAGLVSM